VEGESFDESELFRAVAASGARSLLFGRQAVVALGAPVLTGDYDFWLAIDDIDKFNRALEPLGFSPTKTPEQARASGRYVLEGDTRIDVLIARAASSADGERLSFEDAWTRRQTLRAGAVEVTLPSIPDLIRTKRWSSRPKDLEDIRFL